jgi:hypothetical protein
MVTAKIQHYFFMEGKNTPLSFFISSPFIVFGLKFTQKMTTNLIPKAGPPAPELWKIAPTIIVTLPQNGIFVFGSNLLGVHGAGAALKAKQAFRAQQGVGQGPTGDCYAIATKKNPRISLLRGDIEVNVIHFLEYVRAHPELDFFLTPVGTGLAGHQVSTIANMFYDVAINPEDYPNLLIPRIFVEHFIEIRRFDESLNSHVEDIIKAQPIMDILDNEKYYLSLMNKRLHYGDTGLLPEEHQWINEYRLTDEYKRIAEELASEAGD